MNTVLKGDFKSRDSLVVSPVRVCIANCVFPPVERIEVGLSRGIFRDSIPLVGDPSNVVVMAPRLS